MVTSKSVSYHILFFEKNNKKEYIIFEKKRNQFFFDINLKNNYKLLLQIIYSFQKQKQSEKKLDMLCKYLCLFVIVFSGFVLPNRAYYLKVEIGQVELGHEFFAVSVRMGNAPKYYKLQIDFEESDIVIFKNLQDISTTFSTQMGGFEYISFWRKFYMMPVKVNANPRNYKRFTCQDCDGILGLSPGSVLFNTFPTIGISRSYLTLGKASDEVGFSSNDKLHEVHCKTKNNLCTSTGELMFGNVGYKDIDIEFDPSINHLTLPYYIYDEYMNGKNIYNDNVDNWENFNIRITGKSLTGTQKPNFLGSRKTNPRLEYTIDSGHFIRHTIRQTKILSIVRGDQQGPMNNTFVVGSRLLRDFIMTITSQHVLFLEEFETFDSISVPNLVLLLIQSFLLGKWFVININKLFPNYNQKEKRKWPTILLEWVSVGISIAAVALPETRELLESHLDLYIGSVVLIGFAVIAKIVLLIDYTIENNENPFTNRPSDYMKRLLDSFFQELIILTGIWILALENRTEGGDSLILLIVNIFLVFTIFRYGIIAFMNIFLFIPSDFNEKLKLDFIKKREVYLFIFFVVIICVYQVLVTVNFFVRPFFIKNLNLDESITVLILICLFLFILFVALITNVLFINHNININNKKEEDIEKSENK